MPKYVPPKKGQTENTSTFVLLCFAVFVVSAIYFAVGFTTLFSDLEVSIVDLISNLSMIGMISSLVCGVAWHLR